jgi:excisionase family DNA binding protein
MQEPSILFTTEKAAGYLGLSRSTLEKWRVTGAGPSYRKHGRRVVYRRRDLDDWSDAQARRSTSELLAAHRSEPAQ